LAARHAEAGLRDQIRLLADRGEIQDVILRYAQALDHRDFERLATCFTHNVTGQFGGVTLEPGLKSVLDFLSKPNPARSSIHVMAAIHIELDGDVATSETYGFSYKVLSRDGAADTLNTRALLYRDRLVRENGTWLIADRVHSVFWETETSVGAITPPTAWSTRYPPLATTPPGSTAS
jgi:hypothetical protein